MKILAIDYGDRRMGFALGEYHPGREEYLYATILKPLNRKKLEHDIEAIRKIISEYEIQKVIIGYPLNMDGTKSTMATKIEEFARVLQNKTGIEPEYVDERLTSFEAGEMLKDLQRDNRKMKSKLDSTSALVILKNYLEIK